MGAGTVNRQRKGKRREKIKINKSVYVVGEC